MKYLVWMAIFIAAVATVGGMSGCSSIKIEEDLDLTTSKPIKRTTTKSGFVTAQKTVNAGGGKQGVFLEPTGDSSNPLFNLKHFAGVDIYQSCPAFSQGETNPPMYEEFEESSFLDKVFSLFGIKMATKGFAYTGVAGETAEQTKARLEALRSQYSGDPAKTANALAAYDISKLTPDQLAELKKQIDDFKATVK